MSDPASNPHPRESASSVRNLRSPVPVWLLILVILSLYWGLLYFDAHGGWFDAQVYEPYGASENLARFQPAGGADSTASGKAIYNRPTCSACHQADGKGTPGQFPPLVNSPWVQEAEPGRLIRIVLNGLNGPLEMNGQAFNNAMVPWKDVLNDQEVADVITYIRKNKEWGNNSKEVTAEQVKAVRAKVASRAAPFTPAELMQLNPAE